VEPIRSHRAGSPTGSPLGVYPTREDTLLLLPFTEVAPGARFLDIGTGSGRLALSAARRGANVVATDLNREALRALDAIARAESLPIHLVRTDLATGLGRFDRVVANPPYLPTSPEQRDPEPGTNLALDGGPDGCRVTARIVAGLDDHLMPDGRAFVLVSTVQDPKGLARVRSDWTGRGGRLAVVVSRELEGERLDVWELELPCP